MVVILLKITKICKKWWKCFVMSKEITNFVHVNIKIYHVAYDTIQRL